MDALTAACQKADVPGDLAPTAAPVVDDQRTVELRCLTDPDSEPQDNVRERALAALAAARAIGVSDDERRAELDDDER